MITFEDFQKSDIRAGRIIDVQDYPEARRPSYKLKVDFGQEIGIKKSVAQLTTNYTKEELMNKQVLCVVNFPPRQIGSAISEVLVLGVPDEKQECVLVVPEVHVPTGGRLY